VPDRAGVQELNQRIQRPYTTIEPEKGAAYAHSAEVDVAHAQLSLVPASGPDDWCTVGEASGDPVRQVVFGGASIEDIRAAGEIIKQRRLAPKLRCELVPDTRSTYELALDEDWIGHLIDAGVSVHPPGTPMDSLAGPGALLTTLSAPNGCLRTGVIEAAIAACAGAIIHPERLDAMPQRDSKLSGRRKPV
jgi:3-isopropylmalate/(R)-2-methylmalate dehydratase large subunit